MKPTFTLKGHRELLAKLDRFGSEARDMVDRVTEVTAHEIATDATERSRDNFTRIQRHTRGNYTNVGQAINTQREGYAHYSVNVNLLPIGAYIEFGTGAKINIPPEWKDLAWQFYVNGRGTLPAMPYLYPAYNRGRRTYEEGLRAALEKLTRSW